MGYCKERNGGRLYLACEMGDREWLIGCTSGPGQKPREKKIPSGDLQAFDQEIERAKARFGLSDDVQVISCYEAGRDGFWLHRALQARGIDNIIVESASIEVNRHKRRLKTDRSDYRKLLSMLIRFHGGEKKVWKVVRTPSVEAEDARHLGRKLLNLKKEKKRHQTRIKSLMKLHGLRLPSIGNFANRVEQVRLWDGSRIPSQLRRRLQREFSRWTSIKQEIRDLENERLEMLKQPQGKAIHQVMRLMQLKAIGINGAWLLAIEFYSWRQFTNRRQIAGLAGLDPAPYDSGLQKRCQGISKAGLKNVRWMAVQLAWCWLRYQPQSDLSLWYRDKYGNSGKRLKKIGIVALARRLLIALWKYLEFGDVPAGTKLKTG